MPEYEISPGTRDVLFRYARETEESIAMVLNGLKNKYLGPETKSV
jgi:hypothetical protein